MKKVSVSETSEVATLVSCSVCAAANCGTATMCGVLVAVVVAVRWPWRSCGGRPLRVLMLRCGCESGVVCVGAEQPHCWWRCNEEGHRRRQLRQPVMRKMTVVVLLKLEVR